MRRRVGRLAALAVGCLLGGALLAACERADDGGAAGAGQVPPELETRALAVHRVCGPATTVKGIDVSVWQGTIDWDRVATTDVRFAYIRIGDGLGGDSQFARNWGEARRVGIRRGAYHYFRPNLAAAAQADHFLATVAAAGGYGADDLPPMIDVETTGGESAGTITSRIRIWLERVEAAYGKRPILYTGSYFWDDNGLGAAFASYPLWTAHWTGAACPYVPNAWSAWTIWQYSATGSVAGIAGNVDLDRFAGDLGALAAFAGGSTGGPDDHGGTLATATAVAPNTWTSGTIGAAGDVDVFRFTLSATGSVGAYTRGPTDTYCTLRSASGAAIAENDDSHGSTNCVIKQRPLAAGTYYFEVRHYGATGTGPYTVRVNRPVTP
jgi:GH25 family lysozyme M1 (1,4-beta-N-acetylmuramidase)